MGALCWGRNASCLRALTHASYRPVPHVAHPPAPRAPHSSSDVLFQSDAAAGPLEYAWGGHSERGHMWRLPPWVCRVWPGWTRLAQGAEAAGGQAGTGGRGGRATLGLAELTLQPARVCKSLREKTLPLDPATFTHQRVSGCQCVADRWSPRPHSVGSQGPGRREASSPASGCRSCNPSRSVPEGPYP